MRGLLNVIEVSMADARLAEELFANGGRSSVAADPQRFLAMFRSWRSLGRVRVVRGTPRRALGARSAA